MMFIWIIIVLLVYHMYKNNETLSINTRKQDSSMEVLKQRYVKGEINDDDFERMKKILQE
ncbi:SHOCT domain-containing protein [Sedimentibacter sp. B4]|uniref:SHOCT domain-containing protein n=1 Tax=Sedimentibacter sp. B4 TaxID=304766 RepID=UPI00030FDEAC|nr:SHOCT domain-containing protein [Sedimentibacter sp. B4]